MVPAASATIHALSARSSIRHVARSRVRFDRTPFTAQILDLTHDGRGVARRNLGEGDEGAGKAVFIAGALPGETVVAEPTARNRSFDEARTLEVLTASPDRVTPKCPHFGTCSGCVLQHLAEDKQILAKERVLRENLERIGHVEPDTWLAPLTADSWGYRRKGRFSVRRVEKKGKTLVGFREADPRFVADLFRHPGEEGDHVMLGDRLDRVDGIDVDRRIGRPPRP